MQLQKITPKQTDILLLLYRYRFLNRIQIQKFLNHKSNTRISQWLKDLTDKKIINRIYSQKRQYMNTPAIYYLGLKSRYHLLENEDCNPILLKRVYQEKGRSERFMDHWQFVADLYFHFLKVAEEQKSTVQFLTATELADFAYTPLPLPDAYITVSESKDVVKRYFLAVIDKKTPPLVLENQIKSYCRYYRGNYWQDNYQYDFPKILLICPNAFVKNLIAGFILENVDGNRLPVEFFLALKPDIQKRGFQLDTWEGIS